MDNGYWKVVAEEEAHKRLEFFTLDGKRRWEVMPMGDLNAARTLVAMIMKIEMKWYTLAKDRGFKNVASQIIVD